MDRAIVATTGGKQQESQGDPGAVAHAADLGRLAFGAPMTTDANP